MKSFLTLAVLLIANQSMAASLACWNTYGKDKTPYMTATVSGESTLENLKFNNLPDYAAEQNMKGPVEGTEIVSNHSPYVGNVSYTLTNGAVLILPGDLSNESLSGAASSSFSKFDGEGSRVNAVIIGYNTEDGEGGGHYSVRLHCTSNF